MEIYVLLLLSVGLAMDAFAVSVSNGICYQHVGMKETLSTAGAFGLFQGIMPLVGYFAGRAFHHYIVSFDHWIAFGLLALIGLHMMVEAVKSRKDEACCDGKQFSYKMLFFQAVATSIDALAVGISFAVIHVNIIFASSIIALITFVCSLVGVIIGKQFGKLLKTKAQFLGGIILICIGIKILIEHLVAGT